MRQALFIAAASVAVLVSNPATAGEVIVLRTGQVGGVPGTPPTVDDNGPVDDCFRTFHQVDGCGQPLSAAPFTGSDFTAARTSLNPAELVAPNAGWLPSLPADPSARWINWNHGSIAGGSGDPPASTLYACSFTPETPCDVATVEVWWAVDDGLGDAGGPNPIGVYLNGVPLSSSFSGGSFSSQSYAAQTSVPLLPGQNWLYVYQADTACTVSGLMLSCRISCGGNGEIMGTKYNDVNCNGVRDPGEVGIAGWTIELDGPVSATTTTNGNGDYVFVVPPGTYKVSERTMSPFLVTSPADGCTTVTVGCDEVVDGIDFLNCVCKETSERPDPCTVGWYPFEENAGTSTSDVLSAAVGTVQNPSNWIPGAVVNGLSFPTASDYVDGGAGSQPTFGTGPFTIATWLRSSSGDPSTRTIVDAMDAGGVGWHFYLSGGRLALDVGTGGAPVTFVSTGPTVTSGSWEHVGVVVCPDVSGADPGSVTFYRGGVVDATFPGAGLPVGSVSSTWPIRIGQRTTASTASAALAGDLDELMFVACCLDASDMIDLAAPQGFVTAQAWMPSTTMSCGPSVTLPLQVCNFGALPRSYRWTIAGLSPSGACTVAGPTQFAPTAGTFTLPAGVSCTTIPITITPPAGLGPSDRSCSIVRLMEIETGRCFTAETSVRGESWLWVSPLDDDVVVEPTVLTPIEFELTNTSADVRVVDVEFVPWSVGRDEPSPNASLDGLPPGEPIVRTVKLPPEGIETETLDLELSLHEPLELTEVRVRVDVEATGDVDVVAAMLVRSSDGETVSVPPDVASTPASPLRAVPNPFVASTSVAVDVEVRGETTVRVFDVAGRVVATLVDGVLDPGTHVVAWDGRDEQGRLAAPGVYWARMDGDRPSSTVRLTRLPAR